MQRRAPPDIAQSIAARTSLARTLTAIVVVTYYGFLLLGAFAPQLLSVPTPAGVPLSFVLGLGLILGFVAATVFYVTSAAAGDLQ